MGESEDARRAWRQLALYKLYLEFKQEGIGRRYELIQWIENNFYYPEPK